MQFCFKNYFTQTLQQVNSCLFCETAGHWSEYLKYNYRDYTNIIATMI